MTLNLLEPERKVVTQDLVWRMQHTERNRMEKFRQDRDAVVRTLDAIPYGLRPEYYRVRRLRLLKALE